jgi:putrescine importer
MRVLSMFANESKPSTMSTTTTQGRPVLRRVLSLRDLILYGIVLVMPIAPVPLFGLAQKLSGGQAVSTLLLAMMAMGLTAISYGRMAALYPSAGSAYTYVRVSLSERLGFLTGWAMFLDYLLVPLITTIYAAITLAKLLPFLSYTVWALLFAILMTAVNLFGIKLTAKTNLVLMAVMTVVISIFMVLAIHMLWHQGGIRGLVSTHPFYNPGNFNFATLMTATSVAALTFGGFDGVTTLSEEVVNPRRNVMLAAVIVCLFTGLFGGLQVYLAQMVWPDYHLFQNVDTAFLEVSRKVGGEWLYQAIGVILILANFGAGFTAQTGVARLLFGMGRDRALPQRFFTYLSPRTQTPVFNIVLIGVLSFIGSLVLSYERSAELINFGAFLAFMGVNAAVICHSLRNRTTGARLSIITDLLLPAAGFLFCLTIWLNLERPAKIVGGIWFVLGFLFDLFQSRRKGADRAKFRL